MTDVTRVLEQIEQGGCSGPDELLPPVYDELRRLAAVKMSQESPGQTLQATALVHDAYVRLVGSQNAKSYRDRRHFFTAAATAMQRILVDRAREVCGSDADLSRRVEELLSAHDNPRNFMKPATRKDMPFDVTSAMPVAVNIGESIGPYKLREQIGEGGMGVVYAAEQKHPVRRKVALKVIKAGMDTQQVIKRFQAERQALAMMDHPNIAKVIDAGSTDSGRPYFVMDLIRGLPITRYCDQAKLSIDNRLRLFMTVCHAVQHAHQKGIIHRDLKPSNVLVTEVDGRAVSKVIDFGVAKATSGELSDQSIYTHVSQMVGTPLYMSPEQAGLSGVDIDTRSDIYSLGVMLYEILTGGTPFDRDDLSKAGHEEVRRIIREDVPPRPSRRIDTLCVSESSTVSEHRGVNARRLQQTIRGELDWISMKAIDKDRGRRYESASALAQDIDRYLKDEPVQACPPSAVYRLTKLARRYQTPLTTALLLATTLLVATAVSVVKAIEATEQTVKANKAAQEARTSEQKSKEESDKAKREAAIAKAVNEFINRDLLGGPDLGYSGYPDLKVHEVLDQVAAGIAGRFDDRPLVEAGIRSTLGRAYLALGAYDLTELQCRKCLDLQQKHLPASDLQVIKSRRRWTVVRGYQGHRGQGLQLLKDLRDDALGCLPDDDPETLRILSSLAAAQHGVGQYGQAIVNSQTILPKQTRILGPDHEDTLFTMRLLSACIGASGDFTGAVQIDRDILEIITRQYGSADTRFANLVTLRLAGDLLHIPDQRNEAETLVNRILAMSRRVSGPVHEDTLYAIKTRMHLLHLQARFEELDRLIDETLDDCQQKLDDNHLEAVSLRAEVAGLHLKRGMNAAAEIEFALIAKQVENLHGDVHRLAISCRTNQALAIQNEDRLAEAHTLLRDLADRMRPHGTSDVKSVAIVLNQLARNRWLAEDFTAAEATCDEVLQLLNAAGESQTEAYFVCKSNSAIIASRQQQFSSAETQSRSLLAELQNSYSANARIVLQCERDLADFISQQGRVTEATQMCRKTLATAQQTLGSEDLVTQSCKTLLSKILNAEAI